MHRFDTALVTKMTMAKVEEIPSLRADTQNPNETASFPRCIVQPPLQKQRNGGAAVHLSFTIEVWAEQQFDAMRLFDQVRDKLLEYNFVLTNNTPLFRDAIGKWRFGGYFETRWNALNNSFERNQ